MPPDGTVMAILRLVETGIEESRSQMLQIHSAQAIIITGQTPPHTITSNMSQSSGVY